MAEAPNVMTGNLPVPRWPYWVLILVVVLAYVSALPGGFVWLDHTEIVQGGYRVEHRSDLRALAKYTLDQYMDRQVGTAAPPGGYWRPVHALSISLDWFLWKDCAWLYHLENIFWHALAVLGLFALGNRLLGGTAAGQGAVFWGTLLFAVHPLGAHGVTWISGRKDVLCTVFAVGALLAFLRSTDRSSQDEPRRWRPSRDELVREIGPRLLWGGVALFAAGLAMGSKELGLIVPALATLIVLPVMYRQNHRHRWVAWLTVGLLWLVAAGYVAFREKVQHGLTLGATRPLADIWNVVGLNARIAVSYLATIFWPQPANISDSVSLVSSVTGGQILALIAVVAGLALVMIATLRRWPAAPVLWWYVLWMLPTCGLMPLRHLRAERYLYPAAWGLLVAALYVFSTIVLVRFSPWARRLTVWLVGVVVALVASCLAYGNLTWRTDERLFTDAVRRDPWFLEGYVGLGNLALEKNDPARAIDFYRQVQQRARDPAHYAYYSPVVLHNNLGLALYRLGRYDEAMLEFLETLRQRPLQALAHYHLGLIASAKEKYESAKTFFLTALRRNPRDEEVLSNLAYAHLRLGEYQECIQLLTPLVDAHPTDLTNVMNLVGAYLAQEKYSQAVPYLRRVLDQQPNHALARAKLAWCQSKTGKPALALENIARARADAPDDPTVKLIDSEIHRAPSPAGQ